MPKPKSKPDSDTWDKILDLLFNTKLDEIVRVLAEKDARPVITRDHDFLTEELLNQANLTLERASVPWKFAPVYARLPFKDKGQQINIFEVKNAKSK